MFKPVSFLLSYLKMFVRVCSQKSLKVGVEGMLKCVVLLDFVMKLGIWLELGSRLVKSSLGSRDDTLGPTVDPSELLGPPGSSLLWCVSQSLL